MGIYNEMPREIFEQIFAGFPEEISERYSEDLSETFSEEMSKNVSEESTGRVYEKIFEIISTGIPAENTEEISTVVS